MQGQRKDLRTWTCVCFRRAVADAVMLSALFAGAASAQTGAAPLETDRLRPVEVRVNQVKAGSWTLLERAGTLYAPEDAFEEWRLNRPPGAAPIQARGQSWYSLGAIPGFTARFNEAEQSLDLVFAPTAFTTTRLTQLVIGRDALSPVEPTVFLNYDLSGDHNASRGQRSRQSLGMLGELGLVTGWGLLTSSYAGRSLVTRGIADAAPSWQRLETTFTHDDLRHNVSLRLGDLSSRAGAIGRPVFFGGVQLSRNFALQPGFISQPVSSIAGTSSAPSTVELYVNNVLRQTGSVPAGPFTFDNLPLLTGAGEIRMVVRDILGRETVVEQPFFSYGSMLEVGLSDWSVEAGALRRNLGLGGTSYEQKFVSGLYRLGLSKNLTAELHAGVSRPHQEASASFSQALVPWPVLLQAGLGASHTSLGRGGTWMLGLEQTGLNSGALLRTEGTTAGYRGLGQDPSVPVTRHQGTISYHIGSPQWGSLGISAARTTAGDGSVLNAGSLSHSMRIGVRSSFSVNLTRLSGSSSGNSVSMSLLVPLESNGNVSASVSRQAHDTDGYLSFGGAAQGTSPWSWRMLSGERGEVPYLEGSLSRQGEYGGMNVNASASRDQQNLRVGATGALVWVDGSLFASRRNNTSLALVEVQGYGDVGVGVSGQYETNTRASGRALLTQLMPYRSNLIRLNASELPIDAELDSIELSAVPSPRGAVKLVFPVRSGRAALIRVVFDDGQVAPAGAEVRIVGDTPIFYVARRGEAFITGLQPAATLALQWKGHSCRMDLTLPPAKTDDLTRVGPLACQGVPR